MVNRKKGEKEETVTVAAKGFTKENLQNTNFSIKRNIIQ